MGTVSCNPLSLLRRRRFLLATASSKEKKGGGEGKKKKGKKEEKGRPLFGGLSVRPVGRGMEFFRCFVPGSPGREKEEEGKKERGRADACHLFSSLFLGGMQYLPGGGGRKGERRRGKGRGGGREEAVPTGPSSTFSHGKGNDVLALAREWAKRGGGKEGRGKKGKGPLAPHGRILFLFPKRAGPGFPSATKKKRTEKRGRGERGKRTSAALPAGFAELLVKDGDTFFFLYLGPQGGAGGRGKKGKKKKKKGGSPAHPAAQLHGTTPCRGGPRRSATGNPGKRERKKRKKKKRGKGGA